ncbi:hypothetical protein LBSG162_11460 [Lentilactobacillus buchneri subsp. silagei]|nr:hypothetical protein Ltb232_24000 [Lentilactobacillus buchneri subsp. silagei]GED92041.1 hypothetical protein LBSG162_11460 [Lentilactobacillus buchneri subsp. silagei]
MNDFIESSDLKKYDSKTIKYTLEKLASVSMSMIESISAQVISNIIKSQMIKNGF